MFTQNALYYSWRNEFASSGRKIVIALLLRTLAEYCGFFIVLLHHHNFAMAMLSTQEWFPATLLFEIFYGLLLSSACLFCLLLWAKNWLPAPSTLMARLAFFAQPLYFLFFSLGLSYCQTHGIDPLRPFIAVSLLYALGFALEKALTLSSLVQEVRSSSAYSLIAQLYFFTVVLALLLASVLNKLTIAEEIHHISVEETLVLPILALSFLTALWECKLAPLKCSLPAQAVAELFRGMKEQRGELLARLGVNSIVGAFLVKWYFFIPLFLQYNLAWTPEQIANTIFVTGLLSLIVNFCFTRWFNSMPIQKIYIYLLQMLVITLVFVGLNLYFTHWVLFSVILMAVFYNSLQTSVNKLVHHDVIRVDLNLVLLLLGNISSLICFGLLSSSFSITLVKIFGISHQAIATSVVLLCFTLLSIVSFYQLQRKG